MELATIKNKLTKRRLVLLGIGFLIGFLTLLIIRVIAYEPPKATHYHANFAVFVDGKRDELKSFTFYEEVQACSDPSGNPKTRVHLHDQNNGLVHVHDEGVTWGAQFANLGYGLTDKALVTDNGIFQTTDTTKLTFIINGEPVESIANRTIKSGDRLLVNYGNEDSTALKQRFAVVPQDALEANNKNDPATCAGSSKPVTIGERFKHAIGIAE